MDTPPTTEEKRKKIEDAIKATEERDARLEERETQGREELRLAMAELARLEGAEVPADPVQAVETEAAEAITPVGITSAPVELARVKYADAYRKFLSERKASAGRIKNAKRFVTGSKVKESEIPVELKALEKEYEAEVVKHGQAMYEAKKVELAGSGRPDAEQIAELERYKKNEIFTTVIISEQARLNALKVENLPPKEKNIARKGLEWYLKQNRFTKIAISTVASTTFIALLAPGAVAAGGGVAAYAGVRAARGLLGSAVGQSVANYTMRAYDYLFGKKSAAKRKAEEKVLEDLFSSEFGQGAEPNMLSGSKELYAQHLKQEKNRQIQRIITKGAITLAAGIGTSALASYGINQFSGGGQHGATGKISEPEKPSTGNTVESPRSSPTATPTPSPSPSVTPEATANPTPSGHEAAAANTPSAGQAAQEATEFKSETFTFAGGKGGIQGIVDLKAQLHQQFPDVSKAPTEVQEFLKGNSTQQAIKFGLFDPNNTNESALIREGSTLKFENGHLVFHDAKTGEDVIKYSGKMFDSEGGGKIAAGQHAENVSVDENEIGRAGIDKAMKGVRFDDPTAAKENYASLTPEEFKAGTLKASIEKHLDAAATTHGNAGATTEQFKMGPRETELRKSIADHYKNRSAVLSPEYSRALRALKDEYPELGRGTGGLSGPQILDTYEVHGYNLYKLSPKTYLNEWRADARDLKASEVLGNAAKGATEFENDSFYGHLFHYMKRIREVTGLKPKGPSIFDWNGENGADYVARGLKEAAKKGVLDKVIIK